jgi:4-amino-4-deoxy-L-arabinose transferase-like glycosyltransferase
VSANPRAGSARAWLLAVAIVCVTALWFAPLGTRSLFDPDEGRYAEIPHEMLQSGDWIIPRLNGLVYLEKPPLQYWLTALSFRWLGESELTARLCTGLAGFLSLGIVFALGRHFWGTRAGVAAVLFTSGSALFVLLGHQLTLDMLLCLWLLAGLACFLLAQSLRDDRGGGRRWMMGCWIAMALAVLTKGLIGLIAPGATLVLYVLWQGDRRALRELNLRWGVPTFILLTAPWFVLAARANSEFLRFFIIREHFQRFLTPIENRSEPWWFFIIVLAVGILPWVANAAATMTATWRSSVPRGQFDPVRVLWAWCAFIFVFFSFSDSKLIPYVLPVIPALALLCASRPQGNNRVTVAVGAALSIAAGIAIIAIAHSSATHSKIAAVAARVQWTVTGIGVFLGVAGTLAAVISFRRHQPMAMTVLCVAWCLASFTVFIAGTEAQQLFSAKDLALPLRAAAAADAPIYSVQLYDQSLTFYLGRPVVLVDYRDEFSLGLDQEPSRGIATLGEFADRWRDLREGYAIMRPKTRDLLLAQGLPMREIARVRNRVVVSRQ